MVFFGEYLVSFTAPGRVVIPKKIRDLLTGDNFIVTKGFDTCLAGYDRTDWEDRSRSLTQVSLLDRTDIDKRRALFSSTMYIEIDGQGRFVIPKPLLQFAQLTNKVLIVGVGDHFELWNPDKWESYQSNQLKA
ncbi:MAG: division/cell wall cluster transcriptional repressor MraZ [Microgenomates group bacterium]